MPNLPYSTPDWTTTRQHAPRRLGYPMLNNPTSDKFVREVMRYFEGLSFSPTVGDRTSYTNQAQQSQALQNAFWNLSQGFTVADNQAANPADGTLVATRLTETAAASNRYHGRQSITITAGENICFSAFVRAGTSTLVQLVVDDVLAANGCYANYNLATGQVGTSAAFGTGAIVSASIQPAGDGWFRCVLVGRIAPADTAARCFLVGTNSISAGLYPSYTGSTANHFFAWGLQFERGVTTPGPAIATTSSSRTVSAPPTDWSQNSGSDSSADVFAYLVGESDPFPVGSPKELIRWESRYARIPAIQYLPSAATFARPLLNNLKSGSTWAVTFDDGASAHLFQSRKTVVSTRSRAAVTTTAAMPSSNITYAKGGTSVAIAANTAAATIKSTLDSTFSPTTFTVYSSGDAIIIIASVVDALDSVSYPEEDVSLIFTNGNYVQYSPSGTFTTPELTIISCTGHGGSIGNKVAIWSNDSLLGTSVVVAVGNADQFSVLTADIRAANMPITHIGFAGAAWKRIAITPPMTGVTARRVQRFYLPGVTTGISTAADIPKFQVETDPVSWLAHVISYLTSPAATTYFVAESGDVSQWRGPILLKEVTEIQTQDVVVELSLTA